MIIRLRSPILSLIVAHSHQDRRATLEHLVTERNLSVNTQHSYRDTFRLLLPFAACKASMSVDRVRVVDITPVVGRQFLAYVEQERRCCIGTRNQRLADVHALAQFIGEHRPEHVAWCGQIRLIPHKRGTRALISYLTEAEMRALLGAPDRSAEQGYRDYVLLLFPYNSRARASEAASVRVQDVDTRSRLVGITGKGNKPRVCPLWTETVGHLRRLIAERSKDEPLFQNRLRRPLTRFGIRTLVERHAGSRRGARAVTPIQKGQSAHDPTFEGDAPASSRRGYQHDPRMAGACQHQYHERVREGRSRCQGKGVGGLFAGGRLVDRRHRGSRQQASSGRGRAAVRT
jgi:site-specific recombinase XerD